MEAAPGLVPALHPGLLLQGLNNAGVTRQGEVTRHRLPACNQSNMQTTRKKEQPATQESPPGSQAQGGRGGTRQRPGTASHFHNDSDSSTHWTTCCTPLRSWDESRSPRSQRFIPLPSVIRSISSPPSALAAFLMDLSFL